MFSQTAEYALRIAVFLGTLRGEPATTKQIAVATLVPEGYLSKILQSLGRAGLVQSRRGLHGGSVLAKPPDEINVYDVVSAISPLPRIKSCPLGLASHKNNLCALHRRLDDAMAAVEKAFRESSLEDLLSDVSSGVPLVDLPNRAAATRAAEAVFAVEPLVKLKVKR